MTLIWVLRKLRRAYAAKHSVKKSQDWKKQTKEQQQQQKANIKPGQSHKDQEKQSAEYSTSGRRAFDGTALDTGTSHHAAVAKHCGGFDSGTGGDWGGGGGDC